MIIRKNNNIFKINNNILILQLIQTDNIFLNK